MLLAPRRTLPQQRRLFTLWLEDEVRKLAEDFDFIPYRALPRNGIRPIVNEGYTD